MEETVKTILTADSAEMRAEFDKAAAKVKSYSATIDQMRKKALDRVRTEMKALELEAAGNKTAADGLRQKISLQERALALAKQTGLSEQAASVFLQKRAKLEGQIAATRGGRAGNAGMAVLEASRAIEDAQYGLRGVLNNIPSLVLALGGTGGLAGALSIAAVAGTQLLPKLRELFGLDSQKQVEEYTEKAKLLYERLQESARARGAAAASRWVDSLRAEEKAIRMQNSLLAVNVDLLEARGRARDIASAASSALELSKIDSDPLLSPSEKAKKRAEVEKRIARDATAAQIAEIDKRANASKKAVESEISSLKDARKRADEIRDQIAREEAQRADELAASSAARLAADSIDGARARLARLEKSEFTPDEVSRFSGGPQERARQALALIEQAREQLRSLEAAAAGGPGSDRRLAELNGSIEKLRERLSLEEQAAKKIGESAEIAGRRRLEIEKSVTAEKALLRDALKSTEARIDLEASRRTMGGSGGTWSESAAADAHVKEWQRITVARELYQIEGRILELRAEGREREAESLETALRAREMAKDYAEKYGVSEAQALKLARLRIDLEERAARVAKGGRRPVDQERIEAAGGRRIEASGGRRIEAAGGRRIGLSASARDRAGRDKAMENRLNQASKDPVAYYIRMADGIESMNKTFAKLGAI